MPMYGQPPSLAAEIAKEASPVAGALEDEVPVGNGAEEMLEDLKEPTV